jgi:hypothetical protein
MTENSHPDGVGMVIAEVQFDARCIHTQIKEFTMTVLSQALKSASNKNSLLAIQSRSIAVDKNIYALRSLVTTRFVMMDLGSMG